MTAMSATPGSLAIVALCALGLLLCWRRLEARLAAAAPAAPPVADAASE